MKDFEKVVSTLDGIITALYGSISFKESELPDWDMFRKLLIPDAQLIQVKSDGLDKMTIDEFISRFKEQINTGTFKNFYEFELNRITNKFSNIAQVFSTYEAKFNPDDLETLGRGINSIELVRDKQRWWVAAITWEIESAEKTIPKNFLPSE